MIIEPIGRYVVAALAIALATSCVVAAATERPPSAQLPRAVIVVALLWAVAFLVAAVEVVMRLEHVGVMGLLVAAAEVLLAGVVWGVRGERRDGGDDGGGDGPSLPPEYWERWEASLQPARRRPELTR